MSVSMIVISIAVLFMSRTVTAQVYAMTYDSSTDHIYAASQGFIFELNGALNQTNRWTLDRFNINKLAHDRNDHDIIYVVNNAADAPIFRFNKSSGTTTSFCDYQFKQVFGIAVDMNGDVLIAPQFENLVYRFSSTGQVIGHFPVPSPVGIAVDADNNIYVVGGSVPGSIHRFTPAGKLNKTYHVDDPLFAPFAVAVAPDMDIVIGDTDNKRVLHLDQVTGKLFAVWNQTSPLMNSTGDPGGVPVRAFKNIEAVGVRANGDILVLDTGYNIIYSAPPPKKALSVHTEQNFKTPTQ